MPLFDRFASRVLSALGLDLDLDLDLRGPPFHEVTPRLVLGSRPSPAHVPALEELGVTHVVSCLEDPEPVRFLEERFETRFLAVRDAVTEDLGAELPGFFDFVERCGLVGRVLVHCEAGVSRSATLAVAHVMQSRSLRFHEPYLEVRARRPQVLPNVGFASQLQRFEHSVFPERHPSSLARYLHEVCRVPVELDVMDGVLESHDHDALAAIRAIFGDEVPRVVQGVRT
ncbi:MAG: dual specificity protein phosphatase [Myxococcota bacterium]